MNRPPFGESERERCGKTLCEVFAEEEVLKEGRLSAKDEAVFIPLRWDNVLRDGTAIAVIDDRVFGAKPSVTGESAQ